MAQHVAVSAESSSIPILKTYIYYKDVGRACIDLRGYDTNFLGS